MSNQFIKGKARALTFFIYKSRGLKYITKILKNIQLRIAYKCGGQGWN